MSTATKRKTHSDMERGTGTLANGQLDTLQQCRANMFNRVILGAFTEAALMIAEADLD